MKRSLAVLLVAAWCVAVVAPVQAAVTNIQFNPQTPAGQGSNIFPGDPWTIGKFFETLQPINLLVETDPSEIDFSFSVVERIANRSGIDWTDFHFGIIPLDTDPNFGANFTNVGFQTQLGQNFDVQFMPGMLWLFGDIPNGSEFTIEFDVQLFNAQNAFFEIEQFPTYVPEPSSLACWSLLALAVAGGTFWRKRRR